MKVYCSIQGGSFRQQLRYIRAGGTPMQRSCMELVIGFRLAVDGLSWRGNN